MLKELKLERFKKFSDLRVMFSPFTVLMGENSSGKTTILQALNLALITLNQFKLVSYNGSKIKIRNKGVGLSKLPGIELSDFRELYYAKRSRATRVEGWVGSNITIEEDNGNRYRLQLSSLFGGFNLKCISENNDFPKLVGSKTIKYPPELQNKPPLFISGFVGLNAVEERIFPVALLDRLRSGHVSSVIRNLVFDMKQSTPVEYTRLKQRLAKDFAFHLDEVFFDEQQDLYVTAQYSESCENKRLSLDFNASGSGFMQVLQILAPIYRFCPNESEIVLLDEPDAHLHPNLQTTLANSLRKIRDELNIQIIISTHSTSIIRSALPSEVVPVSSTVNICKPLIEQKDLDDEIRAKIDSYHLAKSVISGKLIFFEDSDTSTLEKFDEILSYRVFNGANTSSVIRGRGKTDRMPFQIKEILRAISGEEIDVIFVRDGDGLPDDWRKKLVDHASNKGIKLIILERFETESYLLDALIITRTIKVKYPEKELPTKEQINEKIIEFLKGTYIFSKYRYENCLEEELSQVALLMNLGDYRNPQNVKSEVRKIVDNYEKDESLEILLKRGMGKETLKEIKTWLSNEFGINISNRDLLESVRIEDLPEEISQVLQELQSKEVRENPEDFEELNTDENNDLDDADSDLIDIEKIDKQPSLFN